MPMSALLATSPDATSPEGRLLNAMLACTGTEPASSYYWRSLLCAGQESQKEIAVCL